MTTTKFEGDPQEIGCDVFLKLVMPVIREASKGMGKRNLAELYAGFMATYCGSLAADFGKGTARLMIRKFAEQLDDVVQELDQGMMQ